MYRDRTPVSEKLKVILFKLKQREILTTKEKTLLFSLKNKFKSNKLTKSQIRTIRSINRFFDYNLLEGKIKRKSIIEWVDDIRKTYRFFGFKLNKSQRKFILDLRKKYKSGLLSDLEINQANMLNSILDFDWKKGKRNKRTVEERIIEIIQVLLNEQRLNKSHYDFLTHLRRKKRNKILSTEQLQLADKIKEHGFDWENTTSNKPRLQWINSKK